MASVVDGVPVEVEVAAHAVTKLEIVLTVRMVSGIPEGDDRTHTCARASGESVARGRYQTRTAGKFHASPDLKGSSKTSAPLAVRP